MSSRVHVLIIRRRYLGDVVLLGSFIANLRRHWPEASIAVLVAPAYAGALSLNPDVTTILSVPPGAMAGVAWMWRLSRARFTHVFNFDNTERTALLTRITGAPFRLGLHHGGFRLKLRGCYTDVVNDPDREHETHPMTEYYLRALPAAGVPVVTREVRLVPREKDVADLRRFVGAGGPVLLVHPGSRSPWRVWPAERFAALCDRVQDELGVQAVIVGGPGDRALVAEIRAAARTHVLTLEESLSLPRFAALARLAAVLLCHDSGPMHVAAAVGTPVVALYGSQNAVLFQPAGAGHCVLQAPLPCTECVAPGRCLPADSYHNLCVRRLSVDEVFTAVRRQFARVRVLPG